MSNGKSLTKDLMAKALSDYVCKTDDATPWYPTEEQLTDIIINKPIRKWILLNCSMCNYPCGYHFFRTR